MASTQYGFSTGDRLRDRNTYFYVPYRGAAFLDAWRADRQAALATLPDAAPLAIQPSPATPANAADTRMLLAHIWTGIAVDDAMDPARGLLLPLIRKFEVTKRLFTAYGPDRKPAEGAVFDQLDLYVMFGHVLDVAYRSTRKLYFLNALLKVNDTLIAARAGLDSRGGAALAWLIHAEQSHVASIAARARVHA